MTDRISHDCHGGKFIERDDDPLEQPQILCSECGLPMFDWCECDPPAKDIFLEE